MSHRKQHFITQAYLKAWRDPESPEGSYIWVVSKKNRVIQMRHPRRIFYEVDFYTIFNPDGSRNLDFEMKLQKNENHFISIRHHKINRRKPLDNNDMLVVSTFVANMFARVKRQRDDQISMWQEYINEIDKLPGDMRDAIKATETYNQVHNLKRQPLPYNIENFANIAVPFFSKMNLEILETETKPGFITSDNPCFMIDPALFGPNPPTSWIEVFSSPSFEVLFPLSPKQLLSLNYKGPNQYRLVDTLPNAVDGIDAMNKIIVDNSEEFIVLNQEDFKTRWFEND